MIWIISLFVSLGHSQTLVDPKFSVGDPSFLGLKNNWNISVFNNDFIGNTDKLMTNSSSIGFIKSNEKDSYGILLNSKLITPVLQVNNDAPILMNPPGINADVLTLNLMYAKTIQSYQIDAMLSYDNLGNFGTQKIAKFFHKIIGANENFDVYPLLKGEKLGMNVQVLKKQKINKNILIDYGLGYRQDFFFKETYQRVSIHYYSKIGTAVLAQHIIQQLESPYYNEKANRLETTLGYQPFSWYSFYLHYVSPYIHEDNRYQLYISPLNFNISF